MSTTQPTPAPTPRTDAAIYEEDTGCNGLVKVVAPSKCAEIERDLIEAKQLLAHIHRSTVDYYAYPNAPALNKELRREIAEFQRRTDFIKN